MKYTMVLVVCLFFISQPLFGAANPAGPGYSKSSAMPDACAAELHNASARLDVNQAIWNAKQAALDANSNIIIGDMNIVRNINIGGSLRGVIIRGNSMWITPEANVQTAYDSLKSSAYDTAMGVLSVGTRRCLSLSSGNYYGTLVLDTNFVDVVGLGASPNDVNIWWDGHGATVTQKANDARLTNFKVASSGATNGDYGFVINAGDNTESVYKNMVFRKVNSAKYGKETVWGQSSIYGRWENCIADKNAWRVDVNQSFSPVMIWCSAGDSSFGGDQNNDPNTGVVGVIGGKFYNCTAGHESFGGCGAFGMNISTSAYFQDCTAGQRSWAMSRNFAGTAISCVGGTSSFAGDGNGTSSSVANSGSISSFTGKAVDCQALNYSGQSSTTNHSFGMGFINSVCSGTLIRCKIGDDVNLAKGVRANQYSTDANSTIIDCFPYTHTTNAIDVNIHGFDNGQIFLKSGATTKIHRLPNAYRDRHYTIIDGTNTAGADVNVKPQAADHIVDINGVALDAGEGFLSDGDIFSLIELWCYTDNTWTITKQIGTWVQETP